MKPASFALALLLAVCASRAEPPLPELRTEPTAGGSIFHVRNLAGVPLTGFLIELVDYPGSYYALWQDDIAGTPIPPAAERAIRVANMTVGAVPDYVKLRAAVFADGSSAGIPEKVAQFVERRRFTLETTRELIHRLESAQAAARIKRLWSPICANGRNRSSRRARAATPRRPPLTRLPPEAWLPTPRFRSRAKA